MSLAMRKKQKKPPRVAPPQLRMMLRDGLILDYFAGGGGASTGIEQATGRSVDIAVNHNATALALHKVNHPRTQHLTSDVWEVDPRMVTRGQPVDLAWFSPDCCHFSRAKGGKPLLKKIRGLAWVQVKVCATVRPTLTITENVPEFLDWGPLMEKRDDRGNVVQVDGEPVMIPNPARKGETFQAWVKALEDLGYTVEWRLLKGCDHGAPTSRERLFVIARCDGQPIRWPQPSHGNQPNLQPYRTGAECMDWSQPCYSIFLTKEEARQYRVKRPLADNTMRRLANGLMKFVVNNPRPFVVPQPMANDNASCPPAAFFSRQFGKSVGHAADVPVQTVTAGGGGKTQLAIAHLAKHYTGIDGQVLDKPIGAVTARDHHSLVTSHLIKLRGTCQHGQAVTEPMPTITAGGCHLGEVRTLLTRNGKQDASLSGYSDEERYQAWWVARFVEDHTDLRPALLPGPRPAAIQVDDAIVVDVGMRMLMPKELFAAQGFPADYIHDRDDQGNPITATDQIKLCGNSVCPPVAKALVAANYGYRDQAAVA